jgi:hypothetical protein
MDVDFLVPLRDLAKWKTLLAEAGFSLFRESKACGSICTMKTVGPPRGKSNLSHKEVYHG